MKKNHRKYQSLILIFSILIMTFTSVYSAPLTGQVEPNIITISETAFSHTNQMLAPDYNNISKTDDDEQNDYIIFDFDNDTESYFVHYFNAFKDGQGNELLLKTFYIKQANSVFKVELGTPLTEGQWSYVPYTLDSWSHYVTFDESFEPPVEEPEPTTEAPEPTTETPEPTTEPPVTTLAPEETTAPPVIELDELETPLGQLEVFSEEPVEEEIVLDENIVPLGDALPQTGEAPVALFYGFGAIISLAGAFLRKFQK